MYRQTQLWVRSGKRNASESGLWNGIRCVESTLLIRKEYVRWSVNTAYVTSRWVIVASITSPTSETVYSKSKLVVVRREDGVQVNEVLWDLKTIYERSNDVCHVRCRMKPDLEKRCSICTASFGSLQLHSCVLIIFNWRVHIVIVYLLCRRPKIRTWRCCSLRSWIDSQMGYRISETLTSRPQITRKFLERHKLRCSKVKSTHVSERIGWVKQNQAFWNGCLKHSFLLK